jgi:hypothetical protein
VSKLLLLLGSSLPVAGVFIFIFIYRGLVPELKSAQKHFLHESRREKLFQPLWLCRRLNYTRSTLAFSFNLICINLIFRFTLG